MENSPVKSIHWYIAAALTLALSACSFLRSAPAQPPPEVKAVVAPELPTPSATHRFEIDASTQVVGYVQKTVIGNDDTLSDIARRFDVGYDEIVLANPGVDPWLPGVGRQVVIPTEFILPAAPHEGIVVNVATMRLFYYPPHKQDEPQLVYTYPIGIGRVGWKTRVGTTKVIERTKDPVWVVPESVRAEHAKEGDKLPARVPPGPDNPLGEYRLRLGWPTYLIHGTNRPYGVGMRVSHGCMHLYPEDIAALFELIPVGKKVTIVNQPYLFGSRLGVRYFQAYSVMEDDTRDWSNHRKQILLKQGLDHKGSAPGGGEGEGGDIDWQRVEQLAQSPRALPVPVSESGLDIDRVVSDAVLVENTLPKGSNWDGKAELWIDKKTYDEIVGKRSEITPVRATESQVSTQ